MTINRSLDNEIVIYTLNEYYLAIKKAEIVSYGTKWMGLDSLCCEIPNCYTQLWNMNNQRKKLEKHNKNNS